MFTRWLAGFLHLSSIFQLASPAILAASWVAGFWYIWFKVDRRFFCMSLLLFNCSLVEPNSRTMNCIDNQHFVGQVSSSPFRKIRPRNRTWLDTGSLKNQDESPQKLFFFLGKMTFRIFEGVDLFHRSFSLEGQQHIPSLKCYPVNPWISKPESWTCSKTKGFRGRIPSEGCMPHSEKGVSHCYYNISTDPVMAN